VSVGVDLFFLQTRNFFVVKPELGGRFVFSVSTLLGGGGPADCFMDDCTDMSVLKIHAKLQQTSNVFMLSGRSTRKRSDESGLLERNITKHSIITKDKRKLKMRVCATGQVFHSLDHRHILRRWRHGSVYRRLADTEPRRRR
jgi:hypothetical protein